MIEQSSMLPARRNAFDYSAVPKDLVGPLKAEADHIRIHVKMTVLTIIKVGTALKTWRGRLQHGQFTSWVEAECGFSVRTAENYIRAAEFAEGKNETISLLAPAAVYKLAAKSAPPELVHAVLSRVDAGDIPTPTEIEAGLREARFQRREAERRKAEAERRARKSKRALQAEEARKREEHDRQVREDEERHLAAIGLIDAIGLQHAGVVAQVCCVPQGWLVLEHLRRELEKLSTGEGEAATSDGSLEIPDFLRRGAPPEGAAAQ